MKNIQNLIIYTFLLVLSLSIPADAQGFNKVDAAVKGWPDSFASIDKFAEKVNAGFKRDDEKARAIFTWIALNVKYDLAAYGVNEKPISFSYKTQEEKETKQRKFREDIAIKTLKTKKGVCEGYATLFMLVAEKAGLEAVFIPGTSKSHPAHIGAGPGVGDHAWNAVKIEGKWKLLDATWGAGTVSGVKPEFIFRFNDGYFFTDPSKFFLNHFPDDPKWLLTEKTGQDFANLPLYYGNYLMGEYEFIAPVAGTFNNKPGGSITYQIKNLQPTDKVHYAFSREKVYKEVKPVTENGISAFQVPLDKASTGTLTIYINQKSVAAYRIK